MYFGNYIDKPVGNNAFSYKERKKIGSECKLYIPKLKHNDKKIQNKQEIGNFFNKHLNLGDRVVFEEVVDGKLYSKTGLENYLNFKFKNSQIYIFDNHNLAFYFLAKNFQKTKNKLDLIHIDQHSDMKMPDFIPDKLDDIEKYTFEGVNVGNYLIPLQKLGIIGKIYQCRTQTSILELDDKLFKDNVLNIDLDFWEENMTTDYKSLERIKKYIGFSPIILIATSPYFINQIRTIKLLYELFK